MLKESRGEKLTKRYRDHGYSKADQVAIRFEITKKLYDEVKSVSAETGITHRGLYNNAIAYYLQAIKKRKNKGHVSANQLPNVELYL
jgi:uncharacterized membrane-anchored protein